MSKAAENDHALAALTRASVIDVPAVPPVVVDVRAVPAEPPPVEARAAPRSPPIGLTWFDELAFKGLVTADEEVLGKLVAAVHTNASGLCDPNDRDAARLRVLARSIAITRAKVLLYEAQIDRSLAKRDAEAVALVGKVLNGANKRLVALLAAHKNECSGQHGPVTIEVGQVQQMSVVAACDVRR
jgi:hypothetical protein